MITCAMAVALVGAAMAQTLRITGTLQGRAPADMKLYVMPVVGGGWTNPDSVTVRGNAFAVETRLSPYNIYKLVGVSNRRQIILPFHATATASSMQLVVDDEGKIDIHSDDADTKALIGFNRICIDQNKSMWMEGKTMAAESLKSLLLDYPALADSMIKACHPSAVTSQYLRLWATTTSFENIESLKFATGRDPSLLGIDIKAEAKRMLGTIDCKMASVFDSAPRVLLAAIPPGSLAQRISAIESAAKDEGLRRRAEDALLDRHVSSFNYSANYEEGLRELTDLTERFSLDRKYVDMFKVRKASIAGTPFPANVSLYDLNGNKVDFSKFRGKYVYVDMWASWCVPCIKEIPHLKALEKDLQNSDVVFLSISIDSKEEAWKKKVAALGLEGNQLINKDNKLGEALNVSGIPFFIIYDKEGKLYKYDVPRPSDVRTKPLLESLK